MKRKGKAALSLAGVAIITVVLALVSVFGVGAKGALSAKNVKLGLDLAGGLSITYQTVKENPTAEEMSDTKYKLQLRVDNKSTEAVVYQEGSNRITAEIPGIVDAEKTLEELGKPGALYFIYGTDNIEYNAARGKYELTKSIEELIEQDQIVLNGSQVVKAEAGQMPAQTGVGNENVVQLFLTDEGKRRFRTQPEKALESVLQSYMMVK